MTKIQSVCVYCGSSSRVDQSYKDAAVELGKMLAANKWDLVYGGGRVGLMGLVADSALSAGSKVVGIIPKHIQAREIEHTDLTELHIVDTMHVRKQMMVDRADAFVILAGGLGTLDEFFEILTWKQLGLHDKPVVMVNVNGYWTKMVEAIRYIADQKFMREEDFGMFQVVDSVADVAQALSNAPHERFDPSSKWI
ncbi:MAG: TIGR00730 family Rossman fold protein [Micavibrio aeruginosavorus]|uniref:Cytokinin riboside 5'-monophosphate phosphoribohydrolase n=1 Tax=Micavibrio aeruginosavorus TaxID=349221 RepID=A0A2W5N2G2_9BACT|nr:MAG: TIGR00730 family Rossman fold protein [Micavibrio aeruginosavorus]